MTKECFFCREVKPIDAFNRDVTRRDGRKSRCAVCTRREASEWNTVNPKKARARALRWQRANPSAYLYIATKSRAKRLGILFDLSKEDMIIPKVCPVLGIPIARSLTKGPRDGSPNVDRIIPSRGYVKGNVHIISALANRIKNNQTDPAIFRAVADYVEKVCGKC